MDRPVWRVSLLLFGSGFCALTYETIWLRQFRLIFGASTAASAAVLAIFMGGLGLGGILLGRRVEGSRNPLAFYGLLELGVAVSAALTPALFFIVRKAYLAIGGSFGMPSALAAIVRLLLATLVLAVPTLLMGGTLPAAARAIESHADERRRRVAIAYGLNTLGAVAGALATTFFFAERLGSLRTIIAAALINAMVGLAAMLISNSLRGRRDELEEETAEAAEALIAPRFVYGAAAAVGFAFLLMELVWYRMLAPLLGGTTFTFGLILAVALLGIGSGSFLYSLAQRRASVAGFALCCACEALFMAIPFAWGDGIAEIALLLRSLGALGFRGYLAGWSFVTFVVIFLPAFVSGLQFPLLISLLGKGRRGVAREIGMAYAWNTAGAIVGSLAGGFGFLPLLTAPGVWRVVIAFLAAIAIFFVIASRGSTSMRIGAIVAAGVAVVLLTATGPTAFWRHTPIGAGRVSPAGITPNKLRDMEASRRRETVWEADGIESSVSVADEDGYAFIVNGKGDGHARFDAGTQVMSGVLAGVLHPSPRRAVVVGLGTGSTAGWLGDLRSIERVDVVEIEPAISHVAEMCTPVNRDMPHNKKVHVVYGDGREFLLAGKGMYDVISSEPSNPFRAGISSLFTAEFYQACLSHLNRDGVFIQFLQAYEVDAPTIRIAYATITSVFPNVETWQSKGGDLLLVGSREPLRYDLDTIRARMADPVVREGIWRVWWANDAEGVVAHYVCGNDTARTLGTGSRLNTDDRPLIEYGFARALGNSDAFRVADLRMFARARRDDIPAMLQRPDIVAAVERKRMSIGVPEDAFVDLTGVFNQLQIVGAAQNAFVLGDYANVWTLWNGAGQPRSALELITITDALANRGDEQALPAIEALRRIAPIEADLLLARLRWRQGKVEEAGAAFSSAYVAYRTNPWPLPIVMHRALTLTADVAHDRKAPPILQPLMDALSQPFSVGMFDTQRRSLLLLLAHEKNQGVVCDAAEMALVASWEPHIPWQRDYLSERLRCYEQNGDRRAAAARRDWEKFLEHERQPLGTN